MKTLIFVIVIILLVKDDQALFKNIHKILLDKTSTECVK